MNTPISTRKAIAFAIAGFTCWVLCDAAVKFAGRSQLPVYEIVAFLGIFMATFIGLYSSVQGEAMELWPKRPARLLLRSSLDVANFVCVAIALRHLSLTLFYILVFTSPMLVAILGRIFLKELLDWSKIAAILTGFLGVVVAVYPSESSGTTSWAGLAACAACVGCFSVAVVWSRVISQTERPETMTFFSGLVSGAVGLLAMLTHALPLTGHLLIALAAAGVLCGLGSLFVFFALKSTSAATVSQYHYTQLISGSIVAFLLFQEKPTLWMLAGAALIIAAGLYIAVRESAARRLP